MRRVNPGEIKQTQVWETADITSRVLRVPLKVFGLEYTRCGYSDSRFMGTKGIERAGLWKGKVLSVLSIMHVENLQGGGMGGFLSRTRAKQAEG